jgi:SAM-dependent methyltransferase
MSVAPSPRPSLASDLAERVARESAHGARVLAAAEAPWGWSTPAGRIRWARRVDFFCRPVRGLPAPRVLEVGCGSGTFTAELSAAFPGLVAIDVSEPLLEAARARHPEVEILRRDAHATGFPAESFDLIVGCSVLHHLDWTVALRELHRVLAPGGTLRFSEPNLLNPQIFVQKSWRWLKERMGDSPDEYAFTRAEICRVFAGVGLTDIRVEPYEFLHPAVPVAWIRPVQRLEALLHRTPLREVGGSLKLEARKPA